MLEFNGEDFLTPLICFVTEYVQRAFKDTRSTALTLGVATVVITHSAIVLDFLPGTWTGNMKKNHAYLNLAAVGAVAYGSRWLM